MRFVAWQSSMGRNCLWAPPFPPPLPLYFFNSSPGKTLPIKSTFLIRLLKRTDLPSVQSGGLIQWAKLTPGNWRWAIYYSYSDMYYSSRRNIYFLISLFFLNWEADCYLTGGLIFSLMSTKKSQWSKCMK